MNDLAYVDNLIEPQDRGATLTVMDPVTNERMVSIQLQVAGPDSATAKNARIKFSDELMAYHNRPPADVLDRMEIEHLARLVISWNVTRDGKPVPFNFTNVVNLLTSARFIRDQVSAFSQDRGPYFMRLV